MKYALSLCLILALLLAGCGTDQVITNLELSVDAVAAAIPLIGPTAGLPAATQTQIENYLSATSDAIASASDILAGPGTDASKAASIVAAFAGIAAPVVPAQYQSVAKAVQQVALLVAKFIASLPSTTAAISMPGMAAGFAPAATPGKTTTLTAAQKAKLAAIKAKATAASKAAKGKK